MIHIQNGNLLKSDCDIIAHCCNCQGGFGSGIAGQIRKDFPYAYDAFRLDTRKPQDKFGTLSVGLSDCSGPDIFNLYGQLSFGYDGKQYVDYDALLQSMIIMMETISDWKSRSTKQFKIGMPYMIGCGLAGGEWSVVEELILNVSCQFNHDIYLYRFTP